MLANQITWPIDFSGEALLGSLQSLQADTEEVSEVPLLISTYNPEAASEPTNRCADPDLDSLEYGLDENLPAF